MVEILSEEACRFVDDLHRRFAARRDELLGERSVRRADIAETRRLDFSPDTAEIRAASWQVPAPAPGLVDRRVEITGPTDPKMAINALNSGAKVWLADLEDANTPHWSNVMEGQATIYGAVRETISYLAPDGRRYQLGPQPRPTIVIRPRGWHLPERHIRVQGDMAVAALVDAGLFLFHNARELVERGSGPYLYLPKLESRFEARLWNDVFDHAETVLGLDPGTIRATVLIETIPAAFEMDEILWELRPHAAGLNAGRWDYLFSIIKTFRDCGPRFVLPDRGAVTMTAPFLRAYAELLVATCHRRGAMAIGGMAAFIPSRRDPQVNETALAKVREDKEREAHDGFDGSWVAHPDLVPVCREVFDRVLGERPNQIDKRRDDVVVSADELLDVAATPGAVTLEGVRGNVSVAVRYLASWLEGTGAAAIDNLMEDTATAEIARSQVWQWARTAARTDTGEPVSLSLLIGILDEEMARLGPAYQRARSLFEQVAFTEEFVDFLTLPGYEMVD